MTSDAVQSEHWQRIAERAAEILSELGELGKLGVGSLEAYCRAAEEIQLMACERRVRTDQRWLEQGKTLSFARLLRNKREMAGFSREQLAKLAKCSSATIKFIETAKHPASRATILRLSAIQPLRLTWDEAQGISDRSEGAERSGFISFDSRLSLDTVLEAMLILDELQGSHLGVDVSPHGCRRVCRICGAMSTSYAPEPAEAGKLTVAHGPACAGELLEAYSRRSPIVADIARSERAARRSKTAAALAEGLSGIHRERFIGCRKSEDVALELAQVATKASTPYLSGVAAVLTWATGLGPYPVGEGKRPFSVARAEKLAAMAQHSSDAPQRRDSRLHGVADTAAWLVFEEVQSPLDSRAR